MTRIKWLDEDISPIDTPTNIFAKLSGTFDTTTNQVLIYLVIEYRGTEYRILRYKRQTTVPGETNQLQRRFARSVQTFARKYQYAPFATLVRQFLKWSDNPAHRVLEELIPQNQQQDSADHAPHNVF